MGQWVVGGERLVATLGGACFAQGSEGLCAPPQAGQVPGPTQHGGTAPRVLGRAQAGWATLCVGISQRTWLQITSGLVPLRQKMKVLKGMGGSQNPEVTVAWKPWDP